MSSKHSTNSLKDAHRLSNIAVVLDSVDAAVITIDTSGIIVEVNPATERLFGYSEKELLGNNVKMLMPEPYQKEHDGYIKNHQQTGHSSIIGIGRQLVGLRADHSKFPMHLAVGEHVVGEQTLYTGIVHDLSYQTARTADSTRLGQILDESLNEIFAFDAQTLKFTMISKGALDNLGYRRDEILLLTPVDIKPDHTADSFATLIQPLLENSTQRISFNTRHKRKDGSLYDAAVSLSLSTSSHNKSEFVAIIDDVTEKSRIMRMIQYSQKLESIGQLTGGIAHDFNNLLTVISGNLELLEPAISTTLHKDILKDARDAASMGARLTNRLLAFASRSSLTPKAININKLVLELIELIRRTLGENMSLQTNLSADLWTSKVDVSQLENSLLNLAINARDAMPEGGKLSIRTENVSITNLEEVSSNAILGEFVKVVIADTGEGISTENIHKIFEPFYSTKNEKLGTGLGLSMVYGFVRQSGGFVDVHSKPGKGASFSLYLPRDLSKAAEVLSQSDLAQAKSTTNKVVLLVEDEAHVRKLTRRRLEQLGHSVIEASNGYEALELFKRSEDIDLIFSDMVMTVGMSGYDLAEAVLAIQPDIAFLMTSGYASELLDSKKLEKLGISLLRKPYSLKQLQQELSLF